MTNIEGALLDLSGVLYQSTTALPGAKEALSRLRAAGLPLRFITNTTRSPAARILERLSAMGLPVRPEELFTATQAAKRLIERRAVRPFLIVHPDLEPEFAGIPQQPPNAVLIGDAGEAFQYRVLNDAFRLLMEGAPLLAIARNRYFRENDGLSLDAGPFVAALEMAAGIDAEIIGKPAPTFFRAATDGMGCGSHGVAMVGDDVDADVNGALAAGLQAILVKTGKYRNGDEERMSPGGRVVEDIAAASVLLTSR